MLLKPGHAIFLGLWKVMQKKRNCLSCFLRILDFPFIILCSLLQPKTQTQPLLPRMGEEQNQKYDEFCYRYKEINQDWWWKQRGDMHKTKKGSEKGMSYNMWYTEICQEIATLMGDSMWEETYRKLSWRFWWNCSLQKLLWKGHQVLLQAQEG